VARVRIEHLATAERGNRHGEVGVRYADGRVEGVAPPPDTAGYDEVVATCRSVLLRSISTPTY
jgi:hypothetical protein